MTATLRHVKPPFKGDCLQGFHDAIREGYAGADFNTRPSEDLVPLLAHGGLLSKGSLENPWTGKPAGTKVEKVEAAEWVALGSPDGKHFPATAEMLLAEVAAEDLPAGQEFYPAFDLKKATGWKRLAPYTTLKVDAVRLGVPCLVMIEQSRPTVDKTAAARAKWKTNALGALAAAKAAGLPTMLLYRGSIPADSDWWELLDAVKGAPKTQALPAHIIRVPNSSSAANARKVLGLVTATVDWSALTPPPEVPVDKMDPKSYFIGAKGDHVVWLSQRLIAHGSVKHHAAGQPYQAGPTFTEVDRLNVADFQKAQGWSGADADGFPGASSLQLLAAAPPKKPTGPKPGTAKAVIGKARLEVGQHEGKTNGTWNNKQKYAGIAGLPNGQAWCDTFVYAMAVLAGAVQLWPQPPSPGCDVTGNGWKRLKRWSEFPAVGAQVFFGKPSDLNHTGLVVDYDADFIYTIEGNTNTSGSPQGDGVYARKRGRRDANVIGYGYPAYPGGIKSADPKWPNGAPTPVPTPAPVGTATPVVADISHFQSGALDFAAAYKAGIRAVVHKITDGTSFVDDLYTVRRVECKREAPKMAWGGYHFARPEKSSGKAQAAFALSKAGKLGKGDVQLVLDLEKTGGLPTGALTNWVGAFVAETQRQTGALPIIYTPFALGKTFGCRLWVARYSDAMNPPRIPAPWTDKYALWQFTNGVFGHPDSIPGLGHVDLSTLHAGRTLADLLIA